jgi:uncharacterized SAM-binding protein YcdF (DUF218 family)
MQMALATLRETVKQFLIPGSLFFLLIAMSFGVLLLFGRGRAPRWGRRWLAGVIALYAILSLQGTSDLLIWGLSGRYRSISTQQQAQGARVIVVLSNGVRGARTTLQELAVVSNESAQNALEAARLYRLLDQPTLLASGGITHPLARAPESQALAVGLEALGVPADRIELESRSRTTHEQAVFVSEWLTTRGETRFVLVTTPEHMRRAVGAFEAQGLLPIPSVAAFRYGGSPAWQPTRYALQGSENAIYEYLAWCLYRVRGWV